MKRNVLTIIVCLCLTLMAASLSAQKVHLSFDHYYDGPAVMKALNDLHNAYPEFTELASIGKSEEGRDIWLLTINNSKTGNDLDKPGIYVDGTIHGNEIQATEVCLYLAYKLLSEYSTNKVIKELVDTRVFYIIPIVNVDGRWHFFADAGGYGIGRTGRVPYDDDRDGIKDEDDYEDLDGDGEILEMRIKDPFGDYKTHPDDPRVMVRIKPGEQGEWRRLGREGIDNDGDGRLNEDTPGYLDMNRNYGYNWQPPYVQGGSGDFPMSGKVTKAVSDFLLSKPNIAFGWAFHNSGGLFVRGPSSKLSGVYPQSDVKVYDYLGEESEKIIPGYRYVIGMKDMYTTYGDFDEFLYAGMGIYGYVGELFMRSQETFRKADEKPEAEDRRSGQSDVERQKFNDFVNQSTMFKPWTKFKHPEYGEVEIGGWRTFTSRMPTPFMLQELVHRNASAVIFTARHTPVVSMKKLDVKDLGNGLKRVRVRVANPKSAIPSLSSRGLRNKLVRPDIITISGKSIEVVSGGIVQDLVMDRVNYVEHRPNMIFTQIPGFGKQDVQWIVRGKGKVTVIYDAQKATDRTLTFEI